MPRLGREGAFWAHSSPADREEFVRGPGRIAQISVSSGGVPKRSIEEARVTVLGVESDTHTNVEHHGGPERAVCLFALEQIVALAAEGHPIAPGTIGENVTVEGLEWNAVGPGIRLLLGERVLLEVTRYTSPCANVARSFKAGDYRRVSQKHHPGWSRVYARVLREGSIRRGDAVRLLRTEAPPVPAHERMTSVDVGSGGGVVTPGVSPSSGGGPARSSGGPTFATIAGLWRRSSGSSWVPGRTGRP